MTNIQHITILQWELLDQTTVFQNGSLLPVMVLFTHVRLLDDEDIHWGVDYKCSKKLHCSRRWTPTTKGKIIHFEVLDSDVPFCMEIFHNKVSLFLMLDSCCSEDYGTCGESRELFKTWNEKRLCQMKELFFISFCVRNWRKKILSKEESEKFTRTAYIVIWL